MPPPAPDRPAGVTPAAPSAPLRRAELDEFETYWRDEVATAAFYRELAGLADDRHRDLFVELAAVEDRHAAHWAGLLESSGRRPAPGRRPLRHRLLLRAARRGGIDRVLPSIVGLEARDRDRYRTVDQAGPDMAAEEMGHGLALALSSGRSVAASLAMADARHRLGAGGSLRAAVFGVNDGLVSNVALIMGVAAGTPDPSLILLAGVAGLIAGAGSMAAGEWVSVRSQRELFEREIAVERRELEEFPDDERHELELIYRAKGLTPEHARTVAAAIMADPEVALDTLAREELGLDPADLGSPWTAAISSFLAFAAGAFIPLLPFLVTTGGAALLAAGVVSGLALAGVGAAISFFTGRSAWRSALRMVLIGGGAAAATYLIGAQVGVAVQ